MIVSYYYYFGPTVCVSDVQVLECAGGATQIQHKSSTHHIRLPSSKLIIKLGGIGLVKDHNCRQAEVNIGTTLGKLIFYWTIRSLIQPS